MDNDIVPFSSALANELFHSSDRFPVNFENAWEWIGYSRKDKAKRALERDFTEGFDYCLTLQRDSKAGRPVNAIMLTVNCFRRLARISGTDKGREIINYFSVYGPLSLELPNTDIHTRTALVKRDADLNKVWSFERVNEIIEFKNKGRQKAERVVLDICSRSLIYGHDYWLDDSGWCLSHVGFEYLITFGGYQVDTEAFGNTHTVVSHFDQMINDFRVFSNGKELSLKMEVSALMKAGITTDWYPINDDGLQHFASVWSGKSLAVWDEFRQLCSTLDTGRYVRFVREERDWFKFDRGSNFKALEERGWFIAKHPKSSLLWTLTSTKPGSERVRPMVPSASKPSLPSAIEYETHRLPRPLYGSDYNR